MTENCHMEIEHETSQNQTSHTHTHKLRCETLESRHLLSATADVVLLVDISNSMHTELYPWFADVVQDLDTKLTSRGIGQYSDNRYSITTYGDGIYHDTFLFSDGSGGTTPWSTDIDGEIKPTIVDLEEGMGGAEDVWETLSWVIEDYVPGFRQDAAIHFVVLTDAPSNDVDPSNYGINPDMRSPNGFHHTLNDMLDLFSPEGIQQSETDPNYVSAATLTFIGGTEFLESTLESFDGSSDPFYGMEILGVDINVQDEWNADTRGYEFVGNDAVVYLHDGNDVIAKNVADDFTLALVGSPGQEVAFGYVYQNIFTDDFLDSTNGSFEVPSWFDQPSFKGEADAFLTWSSGGTMWDVAPLLAQPSIGTEYREALVDDIFDKIARQVTDFNSDFQGTNSFIGNALTGQIGDAEDIDALFDMIGASNPTDDQLGRFDLNSSGTIELGDVFLLVLAIYDTYFGDANLDGAVDNDDLNILGVHWYQSVSSWAQADFNGDGIVDPADLNLIGLNWLQGT